MNAQEYIKHIEEESKKRLQEFLDRKNKDGLTTNLILDVYRYFGSDISNTVKHLLEDKTAINYSTNVYKIQCVINDKIANDLKEFEEIKQRALKIKTDSTLEGKWEDELLPEKEYNFTRNVDEYLKVFLNDLTTEENSKTYPQEPQPREELLEIIDSIKDYFIGFTKSTTFSYNHKPYMNNNVVAFDSREELVEYCSNLKNCVLFRVLKIEKLNKFKLRYGQVEDENPNTQTESNN
jgi:hypothetical protein